MKSLLCEGHGRVRLAEVPDPVPQHSEALIRIDASAVCGSERGVLMSGSAGNSGHEACGTVVDPGGSQFRSGDRVGIAAVVGCGDCDRCRIGRETHCRRGPRVSDGWHSEYVAVDASAIRELPDGIDPGVGALVTGDSLGVPTRGLHRAPSEPGDRVVVIGLGPVGLGHVVVRGFTGANVIGIEPSAYRRQLAVRLGASLAVPPGIDIGPRARVVIECTGRPECIELAFKMVENGGVVLQSGECHTMVPLNPSDTFIRREITYTGSWYYSTEDYPEMRTLFAKGLPLANMCTHDVEAEKAQSAITDFLDGNSGKILLRWN